MSLSKEVRDLIRELESSKEAKRSGWTVTRPRRGGNYNVALNGSRMVTISHSPRDRHAIKNARADLRHVGFPFA